MTKPIIRPREKYRNAPGPITAPSLLAALTVLLALWIAIPRVACAELHQELRDAQEVLLEAVDPVSSTARSIQELSPRTGDPAARWLATKINAAAQENDLDPKLLVAIAYRESSFSRRVGLGLRTGRLGEVGLFQVHGYGLRFAPREGGRRCKQSDPACSIKTGARFLAHVRDDLCPGSWWRWVSGYGRRSCPSEGVARTCKSARTARRWYCVVRSDCVERWPD